MHLEHQIDGSKPQDWYNMSTSREQRKYTGGCLTHWKDILRTRTPGLHKYKRDTKSGVWCGKGHRKDIIMHGRDIVSILRCSILQRTFQ